MRAIISISSHLLWVFSNAIDTFILILYSGTLTRLFVSSVSLKVHLLRFPYKAMSYMNSDDLTSCFQDLMP